MCVCVCARVCVHMSVCVCVCVHVCVCMCVVGKGDEVRTNKIIGTSGLAHISMSGGLCSPLASTSGAATNKRAFCAGVSSSIQKPLSLSLSTISLLLGTQRHSQ